MREVFTHSDFTQVGYYKSILDEAKIASFIRNQNANNPDMAGANCAAVLCVLDDEDYEEALWLLKSVRHQPGVVGPDWNCPSCSEANPSNFEVCWKCDAVRPTS